MAEGISFRILTDPIKKDLRQIDRDTDRATMWALRAVGRKVKQEARRRAPVYGGTQKSMSIHARRSVRVTTGGKGADGKRAYGNSIAIVPGLLKNSISSSRQLRKYGAGTYGLTIGPRGGHVHLYAAKQEARTPYMAPAHEIASGQLTELAAKAWDRAMRKAGR